MRRAAKGTFAARRIKKNDETSRREFMNSYSQQQ